MIPARASLLPMGALVALGWSAARPARACQPDPCEQSNRWSQFMLVTEVIAPDGVLVFRTRKNPGDATIEDALAYADLLVTDPGGSPVDGTFEWLPDARAMVWRPSAPLLASTGYDATLLVDNTALATALDPEWIVGERWCGEDIAEALSFATSAAPLPPLGVPPLSMSGSHLVDPVWALDALVCCDGAYPSASYLCTDEVDISWSGGHCYPGVGYGRAGVIAQIDADALPPEVASDLVLRLERTDTIGLREYATPGTLSVGMHDDEPLCARVELIGLAHGEIWQGPEQCHGDDRLDQLGEHPTDPSPGLTGCSGEPYTCSILQSTQWDPEDCMPWNDPGGEDETGGDPTGGDPTAGDGTGGGATDGGSGGGATGGGGDSADDAGLDDGGDGGPGTAGCGCRARSGMPGGAASWLLGLGLLGVSIRRRR